MKKEEIWEAALAQIQLDISPANFTAWFRDTKVISKEKNQVTVSTPNSFAKEWLANKYHNLILNTFRNLDLGIKKINYVVGKPVFKNLKTKACPMSIQDAGQLGFQKLEIDSKTNLNPRYTFESFVIGPFNEMAHATSWAVAKDPGNVYNPLFIYGGVGLGKTHLLQAIGNKALKDFPKKKIIYVSSERFTTELVSAIRNKQMDKFKAKYRSFDVLIIDDIQFLAGKEKTQEEFFHIFNALYEKNKQIIISSDHLPKTIPTLTERLRSRFEGGMIADISNPDYETRMAILETKCEEKKAHIDKEILGYVASNIQSNIRELEGALNCLVAYQKINEKSIDINTAKSLLKNIIFSPDKVITSKKIIQSVIDFYELKKEDVLSSSRKKEFVRPRQIAMYLLRQELKSSYPFIGRKLGGKDHTTAIYACEKIKEEIQKNDGLSREINMIKQRILSV